MTNEVIKSFALPRRNLVIAAAGCGKTELIARAVASFAERRQLILTHTHAGVRALRDRLKNVKADPKFYRVDTIAGLALRYATSFPKISGCSVIEPKTEEDYRNVYTSCLSAFNNSHIRDVILKTYSGFYVDEYQDCTKRQHSIIMLLAQFLPCRIVGDPLQGIFDFVKDDPLVDWNKDVFPHFSRLPDLTTPYRWIRKNEKLGAWLSKVRLSLLNGKMIDLGSYRIPLCTNCNRIAKQLETCKRLLAYKRDTIAVIRKWDKQAYSLGKNLRGLYSCMEEVECRTLMKFCNKFDQSTPTQRPYIILTFVKECVTSFPSVLKTLLKTYEEEKIPSSRITLKYPNLITAIEALKKTKNFKPIDRVLDEIISIQDVKIYRRELYNELRKAVLNFDPNRDNSLSSSAWRSRESARRVGRPISYRTVARTLLVKGLEFDHVIIPDIDDFDDAKNLYVALTRGSRSLKILSKEKLITRPIPNFSC